MRRGGGGVIACIRMFAMRSHMGLAVVVMVVVVVVAVVVVVHGGAGEVEVSPKPVRILNVDFI